MSEKVDFDKHAEIYENQLSDDLSFFGEESSYFAEYKIKILSEEIKSKPSNILEYGCGIGMNLIYLKKYFPDSEITGCDISMKSLEVSKKRIQDIKYFVIDEDEISNRMSMYDVIFVSNVFHHIEPPLRQKAINNIYRMLKRKGVVYFFEHNPYNPVTRRIVNNCIWDTDAILLKPTESKHLFDVNKFKIITKKYTLYFPSFLKALRKIEKLLWFIPLGGQYYIVAEKE